MDESSSAKVNEVISVHVEINAVYSHVVPQGQHVDVMKGTKDGMDKRGNDREWEENQ